MLVCIIVTIKLSVTIVAKKYSATVWTYIGLVAGNDLKY